MSYGVEWMGGGAVVGFGTVLFLLLVPEFAAIAVLVAAVAVLVGLVALAAAALVSPCLLVRSVRRGARPKRNTMDPLAEREPGAERSSNRVRVLGRAPVTAFAQHEPDTAAPVLEDAA